MRRILLAGALLIVSDGICAAARPPIGTNLNGLFVHLLDCGSFKGAGNWGALEYLGQPRSEAPKYDALKRFIEGE